MLYVLDEPTIGLHPRDNDRLLDTLEALRSKGNSLIIVEHDDETMRRADYIVDTRARPRRARWRGRRAGDPRANSGRPEVDHGKTFADANAPPDAGSAPFTQRWRTDQWIELEGAAANNLQGGGRAFPGRPAVGDHRD